MYYVCTDLRRSFQQMMAKFAEDDRIEQMNAQKRRMKQQEHRRAVERLIEERRLQYEREKVSTGVNSLRC